MGEKVKEILVQIMPGSSSATLKRVTDKFTEYFASKKKTIFQRYIINSTREGSKRVKMLTRLLQHYTR